MWMVNGVKYAHEGSLVWITLRMTGLPVRCPAPFRPVARYAPVQLAVGLGSIRPVGREVAIAARREMVVNGFAAGLAESIDYVEHAAADAGAKVVNMHPGFVSQFFHGRDVTIGEVHHMDVIAHAGTIFGRIVVTKNGQRFATANGDPAM